MLWVTMKPPRALHALHLSRSPSLRITLRKRLHISVVGASSALMLACALLASPDHALAQSQSSHPLQQALQQVVDQQSSAGLGKVALYAIQLNTHKSVPIDADLPVQTASVIKLAILYEAMIQIRAGKASWNEPITLHPGEAVAGSGILTFFNAPTTLTLKDMLTLMVIVSDNTATNLAIDRLGIDPVNARMQALGLVHTHLYKKVMKPATEPMPADQPKFGLGKSTPREMATLMTYIGECQLHEQGSAAAPGAPTFAAPDTADFAVCGVAIDMLKHQFYRETIPRYLEQEDTSETGTAIANKTGSLDAVRNDVAIVMGKSGPMVLSIFTYDNHDQGWTVDNEAEMTIAKLAKTIVTAWSPAGLDGSTLGPGLGLSQFALSRPGNAAASKP
jgi:beta-lactamase class A